MEVIEFLEELLSKVTLSAGDPELEKYTRLVIEARKFLETSKKSESEK